MTDRNIRATICVPSLRKSLSESCLSDVAALMKCMRDGNDKVRNGSVKFKFPPLYASL